MDLLDEPAPGQNLPEFSVSEISGAVKRALEDQFGRIRVKGEVGRVVRARSGHMYFDVKDDRNTLACTTWKGQVARLAVTPEEGLEVVVTGRLTAYGAQSKYNMNVDEVAVAGQGALMALLEKRKKALAAEGLFDVARKQPLPFLPGVIGVVTSPTGAVIRDILHRLRDRFPRKVLIWPVAVQGERCAPEVARAIAGFNALTPGGALPRPDLIIVARGGGSVEDLWGFNEESVARAAAASAIPLVSAVGHETDTTLIDFVADQRAPTPTAAAELAVPVRLELMGWVDDKGARLIRSMGQRIATGRHRVVDLARSLPRADGLLDAPRQRLDRLEDRLATALVAGVERRRTRLAERAGSLRPGVLNGHLRRAQERLERESALLLPRLVRNVSDQCKRLEAISSRLSAAPLKTQVSHRRERLNALAARFQSVSAQQVSRLRTQLEATDRLRETLSYKATLARGYAVVRAEGEVVTTRAEAAKRTALEIEFADGTWTTGQTVRKPKRKDTDTSGQGRLF
jgi:exodeoxyribonuclease VII large subunit